MTQAEQDVPTKVRLTMAEGDITRVADVDAIVNAANSALQRGGGVDGAIHRAAGPGLQRELDGLGGCPTGECRLSGGHELPLKAIIHCVGPVWQGGNAAEDDLLADCYRNAIRVAAAHGLRRIAFPGISTGVYGFPKERAARVAVATVRTEAAAQGLAEVRFVCFDRENADIYRRLLSLSP